MVVACGHGHSRTEGAYSVFLLLFPPGLEIDVVEVGADVRSEWL